MRILRFLAVGVMVSAAVFGACTSSNSPTNNIQTNSNYDSQYRDQTRSSSNNQTGQQLQDEGELGDPPITLMLLAMETGDVFPGEDYFVYVVDDNPDGRDLEYEWSVANGDAYQVAEADRGRLRTLVEEEYNTAQPEQQAAPTGAEGVADGAFADGGQQAAGQTPPGAQAPGTGGQPATGSGAGQPATGGQQAPATGGTSGRQDLNAAGVPQGESSDTAPPADNANLFLDSGSGGTGSTGDTGTTDTGTKPEEEMIYRPYDVGKLTEEYTYEDGRLVTIIPPGMTHWPSGEPFPPDFMAIMNKLSINEPLTDDDIVTFEAFDNKMRNWEEIEELGNQQRDSSVNDGYILRRMVIAGQAVIDADGRRRDNEVAGNVVDQSIENATSLLEEQLDTELDAPASGSRSSDLDSRGLRYEYQAWQEDEGEPRRRGLGGYSGEYDDEEPLTEEESYERYTLVTDDPYIEWTPRRPGRVNIFVRAMYHGEYVTDALKLEVEVRLRDPEVELVKDFADVVREDEAVFARLDGSNLPDFDKGLFTLSFDNTKLSFREAELGEFFDDYPDASIYYAQPNKDEGRVLLAVDSNTMVSEPSGDGPLVYVKFKAKEDLETADETQLAMVMDTSARYILNKEGENILPLPLNLPPWRTQLTMPPALPNYERQNTPGTQAGSQPSGGNRTPPGAQAPAGQGTGGNTNQNITSGSNTNQVPSGSSGSGFTQNTGFLSSGSPARPSGGTTTGGTTTGGTTTGGTTTGGTTTGGTTTGGTTDGGTTTGGSTDDGAATPGTARGGVSSADEDDESTTGAEETPSKTGEEKEKSSGDGEATGSKEEPAQDPDDDPSAEPDQPEEPAKEPNGDDPQKKDEPQKDPPPKTDD